MSLAAECQVNQGEWGLKTEDISSYDARTETFKKKKKKNWSRGTWKRCYMEFIRGNRVCNCRGTEGKKRKEKLHAVWNPSNQEGDFVVKK